MTPEYCLMLVEYSQHTWGWPMVPLAITFFSGRKSSSLSTDHQDAASRECSIGTIMTLLVIETKSYNSKKTCIALYIHKCIRLYKKKSVRIDGSDNCSYCCFLMTVRNPLNQKPAAERTNPILTSEVKQQSQATKQIGKTHLVGGFNPSEKYESQLG